MVRAEDDDRDAATGKALLVGNILVARNQHVEAIGLGNRQKLTVFERAPSHFGGGDDFMVRENGPQADRHVCIKQETGHAAVRR